MGFFNFFSSSGGQNSMQQEMNQGMLSALQAQLQKTTWPTARNQLIAQINSLQQQTDPGKMQAPQSWPNPPPQQQLPSQPPTQVLSNQTLSQASQPCSGLSEQQKLAILTSIDNEISGMKAALNKIEAFIKELKL